MMTVSLYTSRIVLDYLGVADYGIYNIVGGIVTMSSFMTNAMSNGVQRFITFALGEGDEDNLKKTFSMSINIQILIALMIFLLLETVGLWFLNTQLNIPNERMNAANWVYQFSLFTLLINIISSPYTAAVIAYERMSVFAYVSVFEVVLKLGLIFLLNVLSFDSLKLYAILMFISSLIIRIIYQLYTHFKIKDCRYTFIWNKGIFTSILSYSGWNMFGSMAVMFGDQGVSIILNMFFGVIVNAAKGVALQVKSAVYTFHNNILTALRPAIIKAYAKNEILYMRDLTYRGARFSFLILLFISLPLILQVDVVLNWWLKDVPQHAVEFTRIILIVSLIDSLSGTIQIVSQATGKLRKYNLWNSIVLTLQLPISYFSLSLGFDPISVFYVNLFISTIALFSRIQLVHLLVPLITIRSFFLQTLLPVLIVSTIGIAIPLFFNYYLDQSLKSFFIIGLVSVVSIILTAYFLGINKKERVFVNEYIIKKTRGLRKFN